MPGGNNMSFSFDQANSSSSSSDSLDTYNHSASYNNASNTNTNEHTNSQRRSPQIGFSSTFNRPRAGTMPSLVLDPADSALLNHIGPMSTARPETSRRNGPTSTPNGSFGMQQPRTKLYSQHGHAVSLSQPSSARISPSSSRVPSPIMPTDATLGSAFAQNTANTNPGNRIRSGSLSLQLPSASVADAFGPGVFSGAWTPSLDDLQSVKSDGDPMSPGGSSATGGEDSHWPNGNNGVRGGNAAKRTLNYLGLDEPNSPGIAPATDARHMGSIEAQLTNASPNAANRLRASTVAHPPKDSLVTNMRRRQSAAHLLSLSSLPENNVTDESSYVDALDQLSMNEPEGRLLYSTSYDNVRHSNPNAFLSRPRANTSAVPPGASLSMFSSRPRAGTMAGSLSHPRPSESYPAYEDAPDATPPPPQTPSRSLWIGNIPRTVSTPDLVNVFAYYGAIESVRTLAEKMCAFVNFVDTDSAVQAKDDVLNRMQGQLFGSVVRIGFGKIDSGPNTPAYNSQHSSIDNVSGSPTRALWVGSVPGNTTPNELLSLFSPFGAIESARVLAHKNCGFVNMHHIEDAILARKALSGREIFGSELGPIKIGFAKVQSKTDRDDLYPSNENAGVNNQPAHPPIQNSPAPQVAGHMLQAATGMAPVTRTPSPQPDVASLRAAIIELSGNDPELPMHLDAISAPTPLLAYHTSMPPPIPLSDYNEVHRKSALEPPALRDVRKRLDSGTLSTTDYDAIAVAYMAHCALLASDYIGNNIVQRFFEKCSLPVKMAMLERIGPSLAAIGCHKNGTWAAQKIMCVCVRTLDCTNVQRLLDNERRSQSYLLPSSAICAPLVAVSLLSPQSLMLNLGRDQFGNYVVQCALRFGSPATDILYDAMASKCWEIGQGRFGARSVRTVLESRFTSRLNQKRIAIAILNNAPALATNINGILLMAWLLDTSGFPGRYKMLLARLMPQFSYHCTHKVSSGILLKIINQSADPQTSDIAVQRIFNDDRIINDILKDQVHGLAFIHKVLASPALDQTQKQGMADTIRSLVSAQRSDNAPALDRLVHDIDSGSIFLPVMASPSHARKTYGQSPIHDKGNNGQRQWASPKGAMNPLYQQSSGGYYPYGHPHGSPASNYSPMQQGEMFQGMPAPHYANSPSQQFPNNQNYSPHQIYHPGQNAGYNSQFQSPQQRTFMPQQ